MSTSESIDFPQPSPLSDDLLEASLNAQSDSSVFGVAAEFVDLMRGDEPDNEQRKSELIQSLMEVAPFDADVYTLIAIWAHGLSDPERKGMSRSFSTPFVLTHLLYEPEIAETAEVAMSMIAAPSPDFEIEGIDRPSEYANRSIYRLKVLIDELDKISLHINGVPDAMSTVAKLARSKRPEDTVLLDEIVAYAESRRNPILGNVSENIYNAGIAAVRFSFDRY